jgi:DNA-binding XRE family transcriptional regulator
VARNVNDIISALPAARRRKIEKRARLLISEEMSLQELRRAREMTEVKMASFLGVAQKQISNIEKRTDMHISTLRRSIEEMGGKLSLVAEFPDRNPVVLSGITALDIQACRRLAPAGPVVYLWTGSTQYGTAPGTPSVAPDKLVLSCVAPTPLPG